LYNLGVATWNETDIVVFALENNTIGTMLVFPYINLRDLQDFILVILMLLIKFITINLCCKLYV